MRNLTAQSWEYVLQAALAIVKPAHTTTKEESHILGLTLWIIMALGICPTSILQFVSLLLITKLVDTYPADAIESRTLYWLPLRSRASFRPATYFTFSQVVSKLIIWLTYAFAKACLSVSRVRTPPQVSTGGHTKMIEEEAEATKRLPISNILIKPSPDSRE